MTHPTPAITVNHISKHFLIPHEKISTLRGAFINALKKKTYEEFKALNDVSFTVNKGEFFGIIGRNGSGKSTLLKILAGIYQANEGNVTVDGLISPFLELGIGFNPELSGRDNIYLNGTVLGLTKKQIDERFEKIVAFSELERFIDQKLKNYSSGMQVRLAFSVSIHANREILLMDEVLAVGDSNFQQKCIAEFNRYRQLNKTVVLVTHDIGTVQRYCDRALLLRDGKIQMLGDPDEVTAAYITQNMNDEEKRIWEEEEKIKRARKDQQKKPAVHAPKKIAEVTRVEFLNHDGIEKKVFTTGETITARIHYTAQETINRPIFGVAFYTDSGELLNAPNSHTSQYVIPSISNKGYVDFIIHKNPFFSGQYAMTTAISNTDNTLVFDFKERAFPFKVISSEKNQLGVFKIDHEWKAA